MKSEKQVKKHFLKSFLWLLFLLVIFLFLFFLFRIEYFTDRTYSQERAEIDLTSVFPDNGFSFTLDSNVAKGRPVIMFSYGGTSFPALVDTGCSDSYLGKEALLSIFGSFENLVEAYTNTYIRWWYEEDPEEQSVERRNEIKTKLGRAIKTDVMPLNWPDDGFYIRYGVSKTTIGQNYLSTFDNVVFDFLNKQLRFNEASISDDELPLYKTNSNVYITELTYNGKKEPSLIDTGNYLFTPRNGFGITEPPKELSLSYFMDYDGPVNKVIPSILHFEGISLGSCTYRTIKGLYSNIYFSGYNKGAQMVLQKISGMGCVFFFNHVIQIDYVNKKFRIK